MRLRALGLIAVMAVWCFAAGVQGQTAASVEKEQVPVFEVRAHAVVVDVVVTRKSGEAVTALHKEDFKVMEDGKEQTIDFFEEHLAGRMPPNALPSMPKLLPNVYSNIPPFPESDSVNVLLLDSLNTDVPDQSYVHQQIMNFLKTIEPGTRTAIFMLGSKLRFVQDFTADTAELTAALNNKKNQPEKEEVLRTRSDEANEGLMMESMLANNGHFTFGMAAIMDANRDYARFQYLDRVEMTLEALDDLARYLGGVPGRKNLIWFSSSFPVVVFPDYGQRQGLEHLGVNFSDLKKTADLLTKSKVAVYPVGALGVMNNQTMDPDRNLTGAGRGMRMGQNSMAEAGDRASQISAMEQLASDTGGKAFYNTNDLNLATRRAIEDGSHYYTLAYAPANKKIDGSYRRIEVKVSAPDKYKVAYRHGYNADKDAAANVKADMDPLQPLLKFGLPNASQLLYALRVRPTAQQPAPAAKRAGANATLADPVTRYELDFLIPSTNLAFELTPNGTHHGRIQVSTEAYDRNGKAVNWEGGTLEMNVKPETWAAIQKSGIPTHMEIDLPNADTFLKTGVYDWETSKAGTLGVPLSPSKAATAQSAPPTPGAK